MTLGSRLLEVKVTQISRQAAYAVSASDKDGWMLRPSVTPVSTFWHSRRTAGGLLILPE